MLGKFGLVFLLWIVIINSPVVVSVSDGCECLVSATGCTDACTCNREENYFPFYPPQDDCRISDNSAISSLGAPVATPGTFSSETATTATKISSTNNTAVIWRGSNGSPSYDQIVGTIYAKNGTQIGGEIRVTDFPRSTDSIISSRITALSTSTGFIVIWIQGENTATANPLRARCFDASGTALSNVQTLADTKSFIANDGRYSAKVYANGAKLALYWSWVGEKKRYIAKYDISVTGAVTPATSATQIDNSPKPQSREIRQDYLSVYESGTSTSFLMLLEETLSSNAQSTLSALIWNDQFTAIRASTDISTADRQYPGATATVINGNFVVLWNEPGNLDFSAIKGITYNAETGAAGPVFDFWITSNTTDMAMDLIPVTGNTLLFGHTRFTNRPISEICYSAITWNGVNIPQTVELASPQCVSGAFGSPDTSAVTWSDGQVATFWTSPDLTRSATQMQQVFGLVDSNELGISPVAQQPVSGPLPDSPSSSPASTPSTGIPSPGSNTPADPNNLAPKEETPADQGGLIAGIVVGVGGALGGAALLAVLLLRRRKKKRASAALTDIKVLGSDDDEGKYISLPTAVAFNEYSIPKQKIQIKNQIASGSFGAVYLASYNNTPVAVKVHQSSLLSNDDFLKEANLSLSIKPHPNILVTLGITQLDEDTIGLVMEYCAGGSLWSKIKDHPPQSKHDALNMLLSVASGLEHLHSHGIIHRDVAARNILITSEGHLKLADFGMSRKLKEGDGSKTNQTIGPAASMAPESIRNGTYSKKSDVWMFGILIYEILSGKKPHGSAENLVTVALDIRETGRIPRLDDTCEPFFKQLMLKCCQFDPDQRPDFEQIVKQVSEEKMKDDQSGYVSLTFAPEGQKQSPVA